MTITSNLLFLQEAADYLRLSVGVLKYLTQTKQIKYTKTGRRVVFRPEWLEEYLKRKEEPVHKVNRK